MINDGTNVDPFTGEPIGSGGGMTPGEEFDFENTPGTEEPFEYVGPDAEAKEMDARAAALLQKEFDEQRSRYLPITGEISKWLTDPNAFNADVNDARSAGLGAGTSAMGSANRDLNRYGVEQTKTGKQQFQTGLAMDRTSGGVGAANNARQNLQTARLSGAEQFIGFGNDLAATGIGGVTRASSAASNRAAQNQIMEDQAEQADTANKVAVGSAAASVLAYAWIAGFM